MLVAVWSYHLMALIEMEIFHWVLSCLLPLPIYRIQHHQLHQWVVGDPIS